MVGWFFLFILVCALLVALYTVVLPKFFIKYRYRIGTPADRGLKIARGENGQSIVYEPACTLRPYIRKYILSEKDGKKSLICKIDEGVGYLDYDVVLFDQKSRAFKGIRVKEFVERAGYTREVDLPSKTCYVSLLINEADGILFDHHAVRKISKSLLLAFTALCVLTEALGFLALRACLAYSFGGLFAESFLVSDFYTNEFELFCSIIVVCNIIFTLVAVKLKNREKKRGNGCAQS